MTKRISACLVVVSMFLGGCATTLPKRAPATGQRPQAFKKTVKKTVAIKYLLYLPKDYGKTDHKWPMILFLHGAGERGDNLEVVKKHGPPKIVEQKDGFPFIVVSPQCPKDDWWTNDVLIALVDDVAAGYRVDPDRVYLTGLSMGGYGTWKLALEYPNRFAAIAPICGGGEPRRAFRLKNLPVWVFHGGKDPVVPVKESEDMVNALKKAGNAEVKFTVYPETGHDSWVAAYDSQELYDWFLQHQRQSSEKTQSSKKK
jgi:predicted peptidase